MADFQALRNSGHFWDNTHRLPSLLDYHPGLLIDNAAGKGASTLLSLLQYYGDPKLADPALFEGLAMAEDYHFQEQLGQYQVFLLDFSDYHCTTVEDTVNYLYRKAEELYRRHADLYYPNLPAELTRTAIAVHARTLGWKELCTAFQDLFSRGKWCSDALLLIDGIDQVRQTVQSADPQAIGELREIWETMLPSSLHYHCTRIVLVAGIPNRRSFSSSYSLCCRFDLYDIEFSTGYSSNNPRAVPPEYQYAVPETPPKLPEPPEPYENWDAFFADLEPLLAAAEERRAKEAAIAKEEERVRRLLPPP